MTTEVKIVEVKRLGGTPVHLTLYITEDIEFVTPKDFDPPTPAVIHRERQLAARMNDWVEDYNTEMDNNRSDWLVEKWYR